MNKKYAKRSRFECRFAVGDPAGRRSSTWFVWTGTHTADVYIAVRTIAGLLKASIHGERPGQPKQRHVGLTKDQVDRLRAKGVWAENNRRLVSFWPGKVLQSDVTMEYRVIVPETELRIYYEANPSKKHVHWLDAPPAGHQQEVCLILGPVLGPSVKVDGWPEKTEPGTQLLAEGQLANDQPIWLVYYYPKTPPADVMAKYRKQVHDALTAQGQDVSTYGPGHRVLLGVTDDGVGGYVEFAADSLIGV